MRKLFGLIRAKLTYKAQLGAAALCCFGFASPDGRKLVPLVFTTPHSYGEAYSLLAADWLPREL